MPTTCGFPNCKFRSRYRGQEDNRHFYRIPKRPPILRQAWLCAIGRSEETVVSQLRICSAHFYGGEKHEGDIPVADPQIDPPEFIELPPKEVRSSERRARLKAACNSASSSSSASAAAAALLFDPVGAGNNSGAASSATASARRFCERPPQLPSLLRASGSSGGRGTVPSCAHQRSRTAAVVARCSSSSASIPSPLVLFSPSSSSSSSLSTPSNRFLIRGGPPLPHHHHHHPLGGRGGTLLLFPHLPRGVAASSVTTTTPPAAGATPVAEHSSKEAEEEQQQQPPVDEELADVAGADEPPPGSTTTTTMEGERSAVGDKPVSSSSSSFIFPQQQFQQFAFASSNNFLSSLFGMNKNFTGNAVQMNHAGMARLTPPMGGGGQFVASSKPLVALLDGRDCAIEMPLLKDIATVAFCDAQSTGEIHEKVLNEATAALLYHSISLGREDLVKFKALKVVVRIGSGVHNVDMQAATDLGIAICHSPAECVEETADSTMSLILNMFRRTFWAARTVQAGKQPGSVEQLRDLMSGSARINGSVLGLIGLGRVGTAVALRAKAFGFRRALNFERCANLAELLCLSDCVSLHCPLQPDTRHIINAENIKSLKFGAFLVNTGDSELVQSSVLLSALKTGHVRAAALDYAGGAAQQQNAERELIDIFATMPNVICTPQCAWYSDASSRELREAAAREVRRALTGAIPEDLKNCVNRAELMAMKRLIAVGQLSSLGSSASASAAPIPSLFAAQQQSSMLAQKQRVQMPSMAPGVGTANLSSLAHQAMFKEHHGGAAQMAQIPLTGLIGLCPSVSIPEGSSSSASAIASGALAPFLMGGGGGGADLAAYQQQLLMLQPHLLQQLAAQQQQQMLFGGAATTTAATTTTTPIGGGREANAAAAAGNPPMVAHEGVISGHLDRPFSNGAAAAAAAVHHQQQQQQLFHQRHHQLQQQQHHHHQQQQHAHQHPSSSVGDCGEEPMDSASGAGTFCASSNTISNTTSSSNMVEKCEPSTAADEAGEPMSANIASSNSGNNTNNNAMMECNSSNKLEMGQHQMDQQQLHQNSTHQQGEHPTNAFPNSPITSTINFGTNDSSRSSSTIFNGIGGIEANDVTASEATNRQQQNNDE
ncbi:hypothetical protein niasHT_036515 [Heterodera trifolii]|uniref:THAP-type domain-containing protein n=1 Tax=Heterodera trifolii TaxID=157864 RepID=A0ABD2J4R8_9BILA